ncbi:hypothetical protein D3C77_468700 [compost metagenome]
MESKDIETDFGDHALRHPDPDRHAYRYKRISHDFALIPIELDLLTDEVKKRQCASEFDISKLQNQVLICPVQVRERAWLIPT